MDDNNINEDVTGVTEDFSEGDFDITPLPDEISTTAEIEKTAPQESLDEDKTKMELYDWLQCIVSAVLCGIFIFVFIGRTIGVDGRSMLQTLHHDDKVIMSNLFYTPDNGDIIIFKAPHLGETPLVKRVMAVAGQTIDIDFDTGEVKVDGIVLDEPYINAPTTAREDFSEPVTVPEGYIFVMGDNRNASTDSRDNRVGLVDTRYILGKVLLILIPGKDAETENRDWSRIGSPYN